VPFLYWLHAEPYDFYRYTRHGLRALVEQAGLRLLLLEEVGGGPDVVVDIVAKHLAQVPHLGRALARALQQLALQATGSPRVRRALRPSVQRFPLGYFLVAERPAEP
jgi:hypothetical protein